jgi:hypothetical protein
MIDYQSSTYSEVLQDKLSQTDADDLVLARGRYTPDKKALTHDIADRQNKEVRTLNLNEVIDKADEQKSIDRIQKFFDEADPQEEVIHVERGDRLNGVYTGHTLSHTRYTSPQERAFLQLADEFASPVVVNIELKDAVDETLKREADLIINCAMPSNIFERLRFKLKNYTLHGIQLTDNYRTNASFQSRLNS